MDKNREKSEAEVPEQTTGDGSISESTKATELEGNTDKGDNPKESETEADQVVKNVPTLITRCSTIYNTGYAD